MNKNPYQSIKLTELEVGDIFAEKVGLTERVAFLVFEKSNNEITAKNRTTGEIKRLSVNKNVIVVFLRNITVN